MRDDLFLLRHKYVRTQPVVWRVVRVGLEFMQSAMASVLTAGSGDMTSPLSYVLRESVVR